MGFFNYFNWGSFFSGFINWFQNEFSAQASDASNPTVSTDKSDYHPGETATITTNGFAAGSTVDFSVQIINPGADGIIGTADDTYGAPKEWLVTDGGAGDADGVKNGSIQTSVPIVAAYGNQTLLLSATQATVGADGSITKTGPTATEVFTDDVTPTFSSLAGYVYADANNDGLFNGPEMGISGVTLTLTGNDEFGDAVHLTTTTDSNGHYIFTNLLGSDLSGYTVTETQPYPPYLQGKDTAGSTGGNIGTQDVISSIVLDDGVDSINNNFGELLRASIAGYVYYDHNDNGLRSDDTGNGIGGVTVTLTGTDITGASVTEVAMTAGDGSYSFADLYEGTYTLTETQPGAYLDGKDAQGTPGTGTLGNDVISNIFLRAGDAGIENNFGELLPASLAGTVYWDTNNDGLINGSDVGIVGATVTLTGTDDLGHAVNTSQLTGANGGYDFTGLRPGTYTLLETQPAGYLDGKDTQGTPGTGAAGNDVFSTITLAAGVNGTDNNFGELKTSSLSGYVYHDANNDGAFQMGSEAPIVGTTVTLTGTDANGAGVNTSTTTDSNGFYHFDDLVQGTYTVTESQPVGFLDGMDTQGTPGNGTTGNDVFSNITLGPDVHGVNNNFGELLTSSLSGYVYHDANNDGIFQGSETAIAGVSVTLMGIDGIGNSINVSTTTAGDGSYSFTGLVEGGTYTVTEITPAGFIDGKDTAGAPGGGTAGGPNTDIISGITLAGGVNGVNNNFGELVTSSLSGFVYHDANNDGVFQGSETAIANATVTLTGTDGIGNSINVSTTTAGDGSYSFTGLVEGGTYTLHESQPAGYLDGKDTQGTPGTGVATNDTFSNITLGAGVNGVNNNFGELLTSSLSGYVYHDANNDGIFQGSETAIAGVSVTLMGIDGIGNSINVSTTTAGDGSYSFTGLVEGGTYTVTEITPAGFIDGKDTAGAPGGGTAGGPNTDIISGITLAGGDNSVNNNFGELVTSSLSGFVYHDANNDGVFQGSETAIANATVTLTGTDGIGNSINVSTTTAGDGSYSFTGLIEGGTYTLHESQPAGYLDGKDTQGTPGTGVATNDTFSNITLGAGVNGVNNNFGELLGSSLSGNVYYDVNNDGIFQGTESGIGGTTVTLTGTNGIGQSVNLSTTTAADGSYSFNDLVEGGTYTLHETQPAGYLDGKDTIGTQGGTTGNDVFSNITLGAGVNGVNNNFGELKATTPNLKIVKSVTCITDKNCDGKTDAGDIVTYKITVTNTGTTTLTNVVVTDTLPNGTVVAVGTIASLAAGQSTNLSTNYTITQADMDSNGNCTGKVTDTATAKDNQGDNVSASASTPISFCPGIDVEKLISVDGGVNWYFTAQGTGPNATIALIAAETGISSSKLHIGTPTVTVGQQVQYKVVVTDVGDVTDHNISVKDVGDSAALNANFTFSGSTTITNLAVGASIVSDVIKTTAVVGCHTDVATATATAGTGACAVTVTAKDSETYTGVFVTGKCHQTSNWWGDSHYTTYCTYYDCYNGNNVYSTYNNWNKECTYNGQKGILLGDCSDAWGGKTLSSVPKGMLFISDDACQDIVGCTSKSDPRLQVCAQAITLQLNINNGCASPGDLLSDAVAWLTGQGPFKYADGSTGCIDANHNGVLDSSEFNTWGSGSLSSTQSTSKQEWTSYVYDSNSNQLICGQDLLKALTACNSNGLQLVCSLAGDMVGWKNSSGDVIDVHQNTCDNVWQVLKDQGCISASH